jgi:hypothetical protein
VEVKEPVLPIADYFKALDSTSLNWLISLRIAPQSLHRSDLVRIAHLQNIAVLDLSDNISMDNSGMQIDERIFKTWMEMSKDGKAFKHIRVLLMRGQADVSTWIFKYLDIFPSLCFLVLSDCRQIHQRNRADWIDQAESHGWEARHAKKSARSLKCLIDDKDFYLGAVSGCYYHSKESFDQLASKQKSKLLDRLPVAEVWIGKPKPWLHLIDEFPGTRTVWFDNTKTKEAARKAEARRRTETPVLAQAARFARSELPARLGTPGMEGETGVEDCPKRVRDMLSPTGRDIKSPPHNRAMMSLKTRSQCLDQIMADFG